MQELFLNNKVMLAGEIDSGFTYSHEVYGEMFYNFTFKVPRLSEQFDFLMVTVSKKLLESDGFCRGDFVYISGQFRSYNNYSDTGNKLILTVFAKEMEKLDQLMFVNEIELNGYICKPVVYRTTPFGREISDILLAVNRTYNKSDYIPCIAWGRNAKYASELSVGDNIRIWGRVQSREYQKKISETESISKTAYEVSISKLEQVTTEVIASI